MSTFNGTHVRLFVDEKNVKRKERAKKTWPQLIVLGLEKAEEKKQLNKTKKIAA